MQKRLTLPLDRHRRRVRHCSSGPGSSKNAWPIARSIGSSQTIVSGEVILRVCILSFRTHRARIEEAVEIIQKVAGDL